MDSEGSNETVVKMNSVSENKDIEVKTSENSRKNSKGDKLRKKDDKSVEQVLKALNSLETTEEKLAAMCKKYADIVDENRKLQLAAKQGEKKCCILQREKEQLQTEHSKAVLSRSRLESLCRELQRQNKAIKEESLQKVREEEEKRKEVSAKFQGTLNEITTLMQQNIEKNSKLKEENVEMAQRFSKLLEQYEIREQQVEKLVEQIHIEAELGEARIAKARMEMANEKEAMLREKQQLLLELEECREEMRGLQENDVKLRGQLNLYTDKYDEFNTALTRSSEVFNGFKGEMEKMSKKICKLEKETTSWKQQWERTHQALLEMAADKQQRDGELALANRRLAQMQALCRTLQAERSALLVQLRGGSEGVKDVEKEDGGIKMLEESKEVDAVMSKGTAESDDTEVKGSTELVPEVDADSSEDKSALSSTIRTDEVKTGGDCVAVEENANVESISAESSTVIVQSFPAPVLQESNDNVKNSAPDSKSDDIINGMESGTKPSADEDLAENNFVKILDANIAHIPLDSISDESTAVNAEILETSSAKVGSPSKELLFQSYDASGATEEVKKADFGIEEYVVEELDSLKQKFDSCIISDEQHPMIKENQKGSSCGETANKPEVSKSQLETNYGPDSSCPREMRLENLCHLPHAEESMVQGKQSESICDISTCNQSSEMKTLSYDICNASGDSLNPDESAHEKKLLDNVGIVCSAIQETVNMVESKATLCSEKPELGNTENTSVEKSAAKNSATNVTTKKSDAQANPKKGKESSRKRKR